MFIFIITRLDSLPGGGTVGMVIEFLSLDTVERIGVRDEGRGGRLTTI